MNRQKLKYVMEFLPLMHFLKLERVNKADWLKQTFTQTDGRIDGQID